MSQIEEMYLIKYALTDGIKQVKGHRYQEKYFSVDGYYILFLLGRDVVDTYEEACDKANELRDKKIKSLEKQISKLEKIDF